MAIGFPGSPFNKKQFSVDSKLYEYNSTLGAWSKSVRAPVSPGTATITDISNLVDGSNLLNNPGSTIPSYALEEDIWTLNVQEGQLVYVTDTDCIYVYNGSGWYRTSTAIEYVPPGWYGDRGVIAGGNGFVTNSMEYIDITTTSSAASFGNLLTKSDYSAAASNGTYGYIGGGDTDVGVWPESDYADRIEQVTISTSGTSTSFGTLTVKRQLLSSVDDTSTYGVWAGGWGGPGETISRQNVIDYINMGTGGTATNFGILTQARSHQAGINNDTYGLFAGGTNAGAVDVNGIDYITIATASSAASFGNLLANKYGAAAVKDGTYGVIGGGYTGTQSDTIEYVTISTSGTSQNFGNLTVKSSLLGATSNSTRGVFVGGGSGDGVRNNIMDYVTIATASSATSFGNLTNGRTNSPACMSGSPS